jgi:hypothetical protein
MCTMATKTTISPIRIYEIVSAGSAMCMVSFGSFMTGYNNWSLKHNIADCVFMSVLLLPYANILTMSAIIIFSIRFGLPEKDKDGDGR